MFAIDRIIDRPPFSLAQREKEELYAAALRELTRHHSKRCPPYRRILDTLDFDPDLAHRVENIPFIPVRLFKEYELASVARPQVFKTMTSSGTSGQAVSRIFLDRETAALQTKALAKITMDFIGAKRLPLLIIDTPSAVKDRSLFSARGAGILGFSMFGRNVTYALDDALRLDLATVEAFSAEHAGKDVLLFGFTYMIWEYFHKELARLKRRLGLGKGILIHGGGWKKLNDQAVDNNVFKHGLQNTCGIERVHNYYGLVEQTGSIFMECKAGVLHASIFSDVIIRRPDFSVCGAREAGLVQLISLLPLSYPGHSLLTEDAGEWLGQDDCSCGRLGKYFKINGRVQNAETRGCSDAYEPA